MADDVLSSFLVKIAYQQDERSRKKFDEGLKQVQTHAAELSFPILLVLINNSPDQVGHGYSEPSGFLFKAITRPLERKTRHTSGILRRRRPQ